MKRKAMLWVALAITVPAIGQSGGAGKSVSISGWVIDSACAYTKGVHKPVSAECAKACAKNGSPLVILRDDGTIFLPVDGKTPASSQNARFCHSLGSTLRLAEPNMNAVTRMRSSLRPSQAIIPKTRVAFDAGLQCGQT